MTLKELYDKSYERYSNLVEKGKGDSPMFKKFEEALKNMENHLKNHHEKYVYMTKSGFAFRDENNQQILLGL